MNDWERRPNEGDAQWQGFQTYLTLNPRNERKCAEMVQRSESTVRRWAARHDWRERATAYDNSVLEDCRRELRRQTSTTFLSRWRDLDELASLAADELRKKISAASPRVLNEILTAATEKQVKLAETLKVFDVDADDDRKTLTINIVPADENCRPE